MAIAERYDNGLSVTPDGFRGLICLCHLEWVRSAVKADYNTLGRWDGERVSLSILQLRPVASGAAADLDRRGPFLRSGRCLTRQLSLTASVLSVSFKGFAA